MAARLFVEPQMGASYDQILAMATAAEQSGFDAFFRSDHYLKMGTATGRPGYTDAWITLAGLARDTTRIRLGTLVTPVTFREPGVFAVTATQVDQMSGGRVDVGLGAGWYGAEHDAYGIPFPGLGQRFDRLEDTLAVLHGVWNSPPGATFEHKGRTGSFTLEADTLRPAADPHPPIVMGGMGGKRSARLAATYAAEFNTAFVPVAVMKTIHDNVRAGCEKAGRDPSTMVWSVAQTVVCGENEADIARRAEAIGRTVEDLRQGAVCGTPDEVVTKLQSFVDGGAERLYLQVLDITDVDHVQLLGETVVPHVASR